MFYIIENNSLVTTENEEALTRFYKNVKKLPDDYEEDKYIVFQNELVKNPDFEEVKKQKERARIEGLTCTKRVFVLALEKIGVDYFEQIRPMIDADRNAKLEWDLCTELMRGNPLIDAFAKKLNLSRSLIDEIFIQANNV